MQNKLDKYQSLVNDTIPISRYMQWSINELSEKTIITKTLLAPNINVHGTGFAGSVYAAAMASGWTLLKYWYDDMSFKTTLLAAEANIKYMSPVTTDFTCQATLDSQSKEYIKLLQRMQAGKSCAYPLKVEIRCNDKVCAILNVQFVFKC
jgi:thioesterase domain-containing protein